MRILTSMILITALTLSACGSSEDKAAPPKPKQGREETKNIRATDAIGYSGSAIANKVDSTLNTNDARQQKLDEANGEPANEPVK